ncbi:MAG: hypothetical protein ACR2OO_16480 [Thermomicrobiales bacterium]
MESAHQAGAGPNPLCEVGKTHPRDKHRMRPVEGHPGVWECVKHGIFATVLADDAADSYERGDAFPMHDGTEGVAGRSGDERPGGVIFYYRAQT